LTDFPDLHQSKTAHYTNNGRDLIDECAEDMTPEQFRGAMLFNIRKYAKRYGRKDDMLKEAKKIQDYANRLVDYEESKNGN
jgi:phosphopentomutase